MNNCDKNFVSGKIKLKNCEKEIERKKNFNFN